MAFSAGSDDHGLMSEINVTPLVDVMLVLLIIFMVTAPMMLQGMDVDLPTVNSTAMRTQGENLVVTVGPKGDIYLDEFRVPIEDLGLKIKRLLYIKKSRVVYVRADQNVTYGVVARIMGEVRQAGVTNLGLVTEPEAVNEPKKVSANKPGG